MSEVPNANPDERVKSLFSQAIELPLDARMAFLNQACGENQSLRSTLDALLYAHDRAEGFMAAPTQDSAGGTRETAVGIAVAPKQIGPYKILQEIGEGGFGTVYLAEQEHPVRRRVALKIIKAGMDTRQVIARFEAERQALAMMDHPNIARVLDAGATDTGLPYFVMELVKGVPITQYCDENRLDTRERLELLVQVCLAVQHAHQKGIIHRDIKPPNVLVTSHDGKPVPKVIDFGIAKATQARLTEKTLFTGFRQMIGTPEYMSPEQAELSGLDVDTRSDVYSLGVLMYELLTGATPFDGRDLRSKAFAEMQRIIREVDPPKPSTRLSSLEALPSVAAQRRTEPAKLASIVRGELDWVVMKCLEKDRSRRYESASSLAADVMHYLADESVSAHPPSFGYRFGKVIRRNSLGIGVAAMVFAALAVGLVISLYGLREASRQRDDARQQRDVATRQTAVAVSVRDFLSKMLASVDPRQARGKEVLVLDVLQKASAQLDAQQAIEPAVQAELHETIGETYHALGKDDLGLIHHRRAMELWKGASKADERDILRATAAYGGLLVRTGNPADAEPLLREALQRAQAVLKPDDPAIFSLQAYLGSALQIGGNSRAAEPFVRQAFDGRRRVLGDDHPDTLASMNDLATIIDDAGGSIEAEALYREMHQRCKRTLGEDHPLTIQALGDLAAMQSTIGYPERGAALYYELIELQTRIIGNDHPDTLRSRSNLAMILATVGQFAESEAMHRDVLARRNHVLGEDHGDTLLSINGLAATLYRQGRADEAATSYRELLIRHKRTSGEDHPETIRVMTNLAVVLSESGKLTEAEPLHREALGRRERVLGQDHPDTLSEVWALEMNLLKQKRATDAEPLARRLSERAMAVELSDDDRGKYLPAYGLLLAGQSRFGEAEPALRNALAGFEKLHLTNHPRYRVTLNALAKLSDATTRPAEATAWREKIAELDRKLGRTPASPTTSAPSTVPK